MHSQGSVHCSISVLEDKVKVNWHTSTVMKISVLIRCVFVATTKFHNRFPQTLCIGYQTVRCGRCKSRISEKHQKNISFLVQHIFHYRFCGYVKGDTFNWHFVITYFSFLHFIQLSRGRVATKNIYTLYTNGKLTMHTKIRSINIFRKILR